MKKNVKKNFAMAMAVVMIVGLMTGCAGTKATKNVDVAKNTELSVLETAKFVTEEAALEKTTEEKLIVAEDVVVGTILLSVNPEIEIHYNKDGMVVELEGLNEDGKKIVADFGTYKNRLCEEVLQELVEDIYDDGYFNETIAGKTKNIVVKLGKDSQYPGEEFLNEITTSIKETVASFEAKPATVSVDKKDYAEEKVYADKGYIGLEKAKELVVAQLGIAETQFVDKDYDLEDGIYELEFTVGNMEYEYKVDALTGKILEAKSEYDDDSHHRTKTEQATAATKAPAPQGTKAPTPKTTEAAAPQVTKAPVHHHHDHDDWDDKYDDDRYDDDWDDKYDDDRYDDRDDKYDDDRYDDDWDDRYDDDDDDDWDDRYDDDDEWDD